jgi:hypothetical protein
VDLLVLAGAPALPLDEAGKYVAGAYIVFVAVILIYVTIMARRLNKTERELGELSRQARARSDEAGSESDREPERVA